MNGFNTRAIHVGSEPDAATGAVNPPVYLTSTYAQDAVGVWRFSDYARGDNPTRAALETCLANLEGASTAMAFALGPGRPRTRCCARWRPATTSILGNDAYGGTYRLLTRIFGPWGIATTLVDLTDIDAVETSFTDATKLVWVETPSNPLLNIAAIAALSAVAHSHGALAGGRQHLRHAVPAAARSSSAPTWWCTRRRSTWADTLTSSAASSARTTRTWPSG